MGDTSRRYLEVVRQNALRYKQESRIFHDLVAKLAPLLAEAVTDTILNQLSALDSANEVSNLHASSRQAEEMIERIHRAIENVTFQIAQHMIANWIHTLNQRIEKTGNGRIELTKHALPRGCSRKTLLVATAHYEIEASVLLKGFMNFVREQLREDRSCTLTIDLFVSKGVAGRRQPSFSRS